MSERLHQEVGDEEWLAERAHKSIRGKSLAQLAGEDELLTSDAPLTEKQYHQYLEEKVRDKEAKRTIH